MSKPDQSRPARALLLASVCFWASLYLYVPTLSPFAEAIGAPMSLVGLLVSSYGFTQLLLRVPTGLWSDRLGKRRPFILFAFVAAAAAGVAMAVATDVWRLILGRALSGVAATMWVVITVLFSSYFPSERAGYAMSLISFVTIVSQLASTLAGGLIAEEWGWQAPFWAAAAAGVLGLAAATRVKEVGTRPLGLSVRQLAAIGKEPSLLLVSGLAALYQFNLFVTAYGFTSNYAVQLGASKADLGYLALISTLPMAIASLGTGSFLGRWFRESQMVTTGFLLASAGTLMIPLSGTLSVLYATQAVGGFGRGLIFAVLMGLAIRSVPQEKRATAMGFFQSIYALGMFGGPALSGVTAQMFGLAGAFYSAAAMMLLGALIAGGWLGRAFSNAHDAREESGGRSVSRAKQAGEGVRAKPV